MIVFSVIIPTLNEEETIGHCIDAVRALNPDVEIIVSDGGSDDSTAEIALGRGARLCTGSRGRGAQMNAGAALARGDIFIFLHADTFLPDRAFGELTALFGHPGTKIGVFQLKFNVKHWLLGFLEKLSAIDLPWFRFGDSSITVRRDFFQSLGAFPDQSIFEDFEFLRRASRETAVTLFPLSVTTSARRFLENGIIRQFLKDLFIIARYIINGSPAALSLAYERANHRLSRNSLLMMVRYPEPGRVKSRLAADVGEKPAAEIYRFCAESLFTSAAELPDSVDSYLYCADINDQDRISSWAGGKFPCLAQPAGDLENRLTKGFEMAFSRKATSVVIVASDLPDISSDIIRQAFTGLSNHDVVIGPSPDGGYYLIGLKKPEPMLFHNIAWSTPAVRHQTLRNIETARLSACLLPPLQDIDTAENWTRWSARHHIDESLTQTDSGSELEYATI